MPRPRRPFSGQEKIVQRPDDFWADLAGPVGVREAARWRSSRNWAFKTPNGYEDPLTHMFVIDALFSIDDQFELRASNLVEYLEVRFPTMFFDSMTVGRVLKEVEESMNELLGAGNGFLQAGRDWKGTFYRFWPSAESVRLMRALRNDLLKLANEAVANRHLPGYQKPVGSPLLECPSLRGEWKDD